ncbi:hypothetical protein ABZS61_12290 [Streptomyces sp. NPDC005566]|uniref:hypothetical protein n=1 Tax=Streptomyces sp. NPDC005566 TaxID=3156886 RepID=UPI0033A49EAA
MTDARPVALVCALLDTVDSLAHPQRMREVAAHARRFTADGVLRPVLEELETGGPYERGLAVIAASVGGDRDWLAARIGDEDSFVRGHALRAALSAGVPDTAYGTALADAPAVVRRGLLQAVVTDRRTELADRLIEPLRERWGDAEAARLLPGCSAATVNRLLPGLFPSVTGWAALGRHHPGPFLDAAERDLAGRPESTRDAWWQGCGHERAVATAAEQLPHRVLDLLERHGPTNLPTPLRGKLGVLASADPVRTIQLLRGPDSFAIARSGALSGTLLRRLAGTAPEALLIEYGRHVLGYGSVLDRLLRALPPARRGAFHDAVDAGQGEGSVITVDAVLLGVLPRSHVAGPARRMADRARTRGGHWSTVLLAESFLPVAEVRERLLAATHRPAAEDRAEGWSLLIRNAGRSGDPAAVATVLEDMLRLRSEQDPVRDAALFALLGTPPALFTDEAEPLLDRIATDAVEARDSSENTRGNLSSLALGVLREHATTGRRALLNWALRTLVRLYGNAGDAGLGRLDRTLRRGQEHTVFEALRPWLEAGAEKADYALVFALTRAVGRRAAGMPELQELLWQAVRYGNAGAARTAIGLWLEPAAHRDERVERILAREPSAAALPAVMGVLTRRRTDLLDRVLGESPPYGRFLTPGAPWHVPVGADVVRWTPEQQSAAARTLERTAQDEKLPLYARQAAIEQLARIPQTGADAVRRWAAASDVVLAEAALAALARTDRPAAVLPDLLARLGDDEARVAVFAASRASRHVRPSRLAVLLRERTGPGTGKVTSRKEMVRLAAARLPSAQAAQVLAEAYAMPDQHPDVRAVCVAFGTDLLGDEAMWGVMADAARGERRLRTAVLRAHPVHLPERHRPRYARLVQEVCATDDEELAVLAHRALAQWVPWAPGACDVLVDAVSDLGRRGTWQSATDALVGAAMAGGEAAAALNCALLALSTNDTADDAGAERDRPARQRIVRAVDALTAPAVTRRASERPLLAAAGNTLAHQRDFVPQAARLLVCAVDLDTGPDTLHAELVRLAGLLEGRPVQAAGIARTLGSRIGDMNRSGAGDTDVLLAVAGRLTGSGGPAEGLFATAITAAAGRRTDWTGPWRTQLRALRQHPVADVRDAAYAEVTAPE